MSDIKFSDIEVEEIDCMGNDLTVVNAARVSFSKWHDTFQTGDTNLIAYLAENGHWSPFAHPQLSIRVKAPIFLARQLAKHQIGLCLTGDTEVTFVKKANGVSNGIFTKTLKELFDMWEGKIKYHGGKKGKRNVANHHIRVFDENEHKFVTSKICNVMYQGYKKTYKVIDERGNYFKATGNHKVYTTRGWVEVEKLTLEDKLVRHDYGIQMFYPEIRSNISEDVIARRGYRKTHKQICINCGSNKNIEVDHIIPVNNGGGHTEDNLQFLCRECHKEKTNKERVASSTLVARAVSISSIEINGYEDVYDISVEKHHNFMANGFLVHNCWNEVSRRYIDFEPEFYDCPLRERPQEGIKQGSGDDLIEYMVQPYHDAIKTSLIVYKQLLRENVAPECARSVLPQTMMTEWIWTGSLYAFWRVVNQRKHPHAQKEAQVFAGKLEEILEELFPVSSNFLRRYDIEDN